MLSKMFENPVGRIILSIILGFGLAALFKQVCKGNECVVVKSPDLSETNKYYYKIDDDCYKYKPIATQCSDKTAS